MPSISLDPIAAGAKISHVNVEWGPSMGSPATVTFGFRQSAPSYTDKPSFGVVDGFNQFTAQEMVAAKAALSEWASVANLTFTEVNPGGYTDSATILFANFNSSTSVLGGWGWLPVTKNLAFGSAQGDVWLNSALHQTDNTVPIQLGSFYFETFLHEIGHALGLDHPGAYNAMAGVTLTYQSNAEYLKTLSNTR